MLSHLHRQALVKVNILVILLVVVTDLHNLSDVVVGAEVQGANVDLDVVLQEVLCQTYTSQEGRSRLLRAGRARGGKG